MTITVVCFTDGRDDLLRQTLASFEARVKLPRVVGRLVVDDSGDSGHVGALVEFVPKHWTIVHHAKRLGFSGTIGAAWNLLTNGSYGDYIFHLEDDFLLDRGVDVTEMVNLLEWNADLAQVALLRGPVNDSERKAGGIWQQHPSDYEFHDGWIEHRKCFTTNPCVYRRSLCSRGWPNVKHSEGVFTHQLLADGMRFAYWGDGEPHCTHIGHERVGSGY